DLSAVRQFMDDAKLGEGTLADVAALSGGTQNIMIRFERSGRGYVLRRGPLHLRPHTNRAFAREMRVLQALAQTPVPHPGFISGCDDPTVLGGALFYLMEPVDGFNPIDGLPDAYASAPVRRAAVLAAVDALASFAALEPASVGLDDIGSPAGFVERQVDRWLGDLAKYQQFERYRGQLVDGVDEVAAWLRRHQPTAWKAGLMHGDFHLANVMFCRDKPQVAAIVDWEMCTQGDPLLDLGWLIATGPDADGESLLENPLYEIDLGLTQNDIVQRYAAGSDRDLSDIDWYVVLACFKLGIVLEGTYARSLDGLAPVETGQRLHHHCRLLIDRALRTVR
ncbi:MAG: phosphotransferase family protein, partial [Antricoccus sp.]